MPKYLVKHKLQRNARRVKDADGNVTIEKDTHEKGEVIEISEMEAAAIPHAVELIAEKKKQDK
ncbi:MAG: hypothetical protein ACLP1Y_08420 [Candidatus Acidiferrales bacterium]